MTASHARPFAALSPFEVYGICQLRQEVFVMEQDCPYRDMDGLDLLPTTWHFFYGEGASIVSCLRLLHEEGREEERRIGRVVTHPDARGKGLAGLLIKEALSHCEGRTVSLSAQAHLEDFYGRFGFVRCGENFMEDGIPHAPMRREAR